MCDGERVSWGACVMGSAVSHWKGTCFTYCWLVAVLLTGSKTLLSATFTLVICFMDLVLLCVKFRGLFS